MKKDAQGRTYWAYGGDFEPAGEHNDAAFCCNGIVNPDRTVSAHPDRVIYPMVRRLSLIHI